MSCNPTSAAWLRVEIWDGTVRTLELVDKTDLLLVTDSTAANGTLDDLLSHARERGMPLIVFGGTGAAIAP